jgi:hypothetical protein
VVDYNVRYGGQQVGGDMADYTTRVQGMVGEAKRHIYTSRSGGRTLCGNRSYKAGFSPCELAYDLAQHELFDRLYAEWQMMIAPRHRLSTEDFQTACDLNGLSRCNVAEAQLRVEKKHALRAKMSTLPERPLSGGLAPAVDMNIIIEALEANVISTEEAYRRAGIDAPNPPAEEL